MEENKVGSVEKVGCKVTMTYDIGYRPYITWLNDFMAANPGAQVPFGVRDSSKIEIDLWNSRSVEPDEDYRAVQKDLLEETRDILKSALREAFATPETVEEDIVTVEETTTDAPQGDF